MNKINLYNQDGSLCSEAQLLMSPKPDDVSNIEWRKKIKKLKTLLSDTDIKEFQRLKRNIKNKIWRDNNPEKVKEDNHKQRLKNIDKERKRGKTWREVNPNYNREWHEANPTRDKGYWEAQNAKKPKREKKIPVKKEKLIPVPRPKKTKEEIAQKQREDNTKWRAENPEKAKEKNAKWRAENSEKVKQDNAKWRAENPEKFKEQKRKERSTPHDKLRRIVYGAFKRIGQNKPTDTLALLGCTWEEAKAHFESLFLEGMTWENHGEWQIDHIRPVASFKGASKEELKQMNHISNLQPLWSADNIRKGDKWDGELNSEVLNFEV